MVDLTGCYRCDDGGIYLVRADGANVWWVGYGDPDRFRPGTTFSNVLCGEFNEAKGMIRGPWIDVARGATASGGYLELTIDTDAATGAVLGFRRSGQSGGFGGSVWTPTGYLADIPIGERFDRTRRNDDNTMHDHLKMYRDWTVVFGTISQPLEEGAGSYLTRPDRWNYPDFICACDRWAGCSNSTDDPPDGDLNFNLMLDREELDSRPSFWSPPAWLNAPGDIKAKLDDSRPWKQMSPFASPPSVELNPAGCDGSSKNMLHCEVIIYGRDAGDDNCTANNAAVLLPGWCEDSGDRVTLNSRPLTPSGTSWRNGTAYATFDDRAPDSGSRVRVSGFLAVDCHGLGGDCSEDDPGFHNQEIHPVYSIEVCQDFTQPRPRANLSGVWHCSDVGTYYLRQAGTVIWWLGLSPDDGRSFTNVFKGVLAGKEVVGRSADLPRAQQSAMGAADLRIELGSEGSKATTMRSSGPPWSGYSWVKLYDTAPLVRQPGPVVPTVRDLGSD